MHLHDQTLADYSRLLGLAQSGNVTLDAEFLAERLSAFITDLGCISDEAVPPQLVLFGFCRAVSERLEYAIQSRAFTTYVDDHTDGDIDRMSSIVRTALSRITPFIHTLGRMPWLKRCQTSAKPFMWITAQKKPALDCTQRLHLICKCQKKRSTSGAVNLSSLYKIVPDYRV